MKLSGNVVVFPVVMTLLTLAFCALAACATAPDTAGAGGETPTCLPSRTIYDTVAAAQISQHCGTCHGDTPNFGAPNSLTGDYASLIAGKEGQRLVDRIAARMANKTMPPTASGPIPHQIQDTLVEWASCGAMHPDHGVGLVVDRPVFSAPTQPPSGLEQIDFTAGGFAVGEHVLDLYQCFTFEAPVTEDRFIRRIEVKIDDSRVLHHVVLLKDVALKTEVGAFACKNMPSGSQYLYAWAPGAGAVQFPEGGMRIRPKERYILQIHYNNGAGVKDAIDSSGVRLYHGPVAGTEYGMVAPGPLIFSIPAHSTTSSTGQCVVKEKMTILAGMPHMHEHGDSFKQEIVRADGSRETLIELHGWSFEMQPFYSLPATLNPGDRLDTTCTWRNDGDTSVSVGPGTADEMCFNFMFVTPPPKNAYCNSFVVNPDADVSYAPGACAPPDAASTTPPRTVTPVAVGEAPTLKGGSAGQHRWELVSATMLLPAIAKSYIDIAAAKLVARGQAWTDGAQLTVDASVRALLPLKKGDGVDSVDTFSITGDVVAGKDAGSGTWTPTCGGKEPQTIGWQGAGDQLTLRMDKAFGKFVVPVVYEFKRK